LNFRSEAGGRGTGRRLGARRGRGVRVGCAPDTFLGAAHQAYRRAIDAAPAGRGRRSRALAPKIDPEFEEATEGEEVERKEKLKSKWAQLEAVVGPEKRMELIARDMVGHFEKRLEVIDGKGMVVCMSRRIAVDLYREIAKLRPEWHADTDKAGAMKVVMTGSASDPLDWQGHIRNKARREALGNRFRDPSDPFRLVIVRDTWLTGFDAPSLHTMYITSRCAATG
jgi:type I site-specific restriction-modification system R (restriction) subunit